jgi:hypothetical protein
MSIDPTGHIPAPRRREREALSLLADLVIKTYVADHAKKRSPTQNPGEFALLERQEDAVLSVPRGQSVHPAGRRNQ